MIESQGSRRGHRHMDGQHVPGWQRKKFKGNKVWVETDDQGRPRIKDKKVRIKYQLDQPQQYWVYPADVHDLDQKSAEENGQFVSKEVREMPPPPGTIIIYTDGASSGNPGPAGIGVVLRYGEHKREISKYIGIATNNIAELKAVKAALEALKRKDRPVRIHTDSSYVHGLLAKGWNAKKNADLVTSIRNLLTQFTDVSFVKVSGHKGVEDNELADRLATDAIRSHEETT